MTGWWLSFNPSEKYAQVKMASSSPSYGVKITHIWVATTDPMMFQFQRFVVHQDPVIQKKNRTCFLIITALTYQKLNPFIRLIKHTTYVNRLVTMLWCNDCFYWDFNKYILIIVLMLKILQTRSSNQMMIWYTQTTLFWDECFESLVNDGHNTKHEQKLKHVHSWQHTYKIS